MDGQPVSNGTGPKAEKPNGPAPAPPKKASSSKPAGGFDTTPFPKVPPGYTLKFTFHRAQHLPMGDISSLSSDPYVMAVLSTDVPRRHKQDPDLVFRTPTLRRQTNPQWNAEWIVANVPASGFKLKCRIYDADRADQDDRLGNAYLEVRQITESWGGVTEAVCKVKKRVGSMRAHLLRFVIAGLTGRVGLRAVLIVSVECLGRTPGSEGGQIYTVGPNYWRQHFSPLIGMLVGTRESILSKGQRVNRYNFQAIQMQLKGPVPAELYHRYVEFRPFVKGMFDGRTIRGRILNHTLHHQHARIYNNGPQTKYGEFSSPCLGFTKTFLDFVQYDLGGKIFTYVITLDGQWRFTETGKEFGIDLLSKHTLHSDVSIYIAFSGEFFVRRLNHDYRRSRHRHKHSQESHHRRSLFSRSDATKEDNHSAGEASQTNDLPRSPGSSYHYEEDVLEPSTDPADYELFIDNDSGTYRPNAKLLPVFREFLSSNLPGLHINTLDCQGDAKRMGALKEEQRERKKAAGRQMTFVQQRSGSFSSISSSEAEELHHRAGVRAAKKRPAAQKRQFKMDVRRKFRDWLEKGTPGDHVQA